MTVATFMRPAANICRMCVWLHAAPLHLYHRYTKQKMSQSSAPAATSKGEPWSPEGTREGNKEYCRLAAITLRPLLTVRLRELRLWKHRTLVRESWRPYHRSGFREPRPLHLPADMHQTPLSSFLFLAVIFCSYLPSVAKLLQVLTFPITSSEYFSQGYLRCCLLGLSAPFAPNKTELLGCALFFFLNYFS